MAPRIDGCDESNSSCLPPSSPTSDVEMSYAVPVTKSISLDLYKTPERIKEGVETIRSLPLPWGQAGLFKVPIVGEVFLHIDEDSSIRTLEPIRLGPEGKIESGLLQFDGKVGLDFNPSYQKNNLPLLLQFETVRFEKGEVYVKVVDLWQMMAHQIDPSDVETRENLWTLSGLMQIVLRAYMGPSNERGEYSLHRFINRRGWSPYFGRPSLSGFLRFLHRKVADVGSKVAAKLHPPDIHRIDAEGFVDFQNPILSDPEAGHVVQVGRITDRLAPSNASVLGVLPDAVRFGVDWVNYENSYEGIGAQLEGLEFAIENDFNLRDAWHFEGSGEIRWNRISFYGGPGGTPISLGCVSRGCQLPQKIRFHFKMEPTGLKVELDNTANEIYTDQRKVVGVITQALLNLSFKLGKRTVGKVATTPTQKMTLEGVAADGVLRVEAATAKPLPVSRNLKIGAQGMCDIGFSSENLLARNIQGELACTAKGSVIQWLNELGQIGLAVSLPPHQRALLKGTFSKNESETLVCLDEWSSHVDVNAPLIVKAMELVARSIGERPIMKDTCLQLLPDGSINIKIKSYQALINSHLKSGFFENVVPQSLLNVARLKATFSPTGRQVRIESYERRRFPYFLQGDIQTDGPQRAAIKLWNGARFPIDRGRLQMARVDYDYDKQRATFRGHLEVEHDNVPEEYLKDLPLTIRSPSGQPQTFRMRLTADNWALTQRGVVELLSGRLTVDAVDSLATAPAQPAAAATVATRPRFLSIEIPPLPPQRPEKKEENNKAGSLLSVAAGFFGALARYAAIVRVPENPGRPEISIPLPRVPILLPDIPLLQDALTIHLEFPRESTWIVESETGRSPGTGAESVRKFELRPEAPVRVCVNLFGHCITQEDLKLEKVELITEEPPAGPEEDPLISSAGEPPEKRAGELVLHWGSIQPPLVKMLMAATGVSAERAERLGVEISKDRWRIPLKLSELQRLVADITEAHEEKVDKAPRVAPPPPRSRSIRLIQSPSMRWNEVNGQIDLTLKEGAHQICTEGEGDHPHFVIETRPGKRPRLMISRAGPQAPIRIGRLELGSVGVSLQKHPQKLKVGLVPLIEFAESRIYAFVRGLSVGDTEIDLTRGAVRTQLKIDEIPFRFGRKGSVSRWAGFLAGIAAQNFGWSRKDETDPFDKQKRKVPVLRVGSDRLDYHFRFQKERQAAGEFSPVLFEGNPRFQNPYVKIFPDRLQIGYDAVTDLTTFVDRHFGVHGLDYTAKNAFLTTQLTDDVAGGNVWIQVPELEVRAGAATLGTGRLELARLSRARNTVLILGNDQLEFSSEAIDVTLKGLSEEFIKRLGLPEGLAIDTLGLGPMNLKGAVFAGSSMKNGDLNLVGDLALTTEGQVAFRYQDGGAQIQQFQSPVAVRFGKVNQMKTTNGKMSLLDFEDFEIRFDDIDATVGLLSFLKSHLKTLPGINLAALSRHSHGTFRIKKGRIEMTSNGEGVAPTLALRLEGMGIDLTGYSNETAMEFQRAGRGASIHYPYLKVSVDAKDAVIDTTREGKIWKPNLTVGPFQMTVDVRRTRIAAD